MRWLLLAVLAVFATPAHAQDQATVVASCGTAHLTAGTQAFRTVDVNGVTCSGASALREETQKVPKSEEPKK